jgi:hypothetical protein
VACVRAFDSVMPDILNQDEENTKFNGSDAVVAGASEMASGKNNVPDEHLADLCIPAPSKINKFSMITKRSERVR